MSLERVITLSRELPLSLREQVIGYAESVERAIPEIFSEIGRPFERERADNVVLWAGIRKLYSVVTSTFWTLENSAQLLNQSDVQRIRIGGSDFSRNSEAYLKMRSLVAELDDALESRLSGDGILESPKDYLLRTYQE